MGVPEYDVSLADKFGFRFKVVQKKARFQPWETIEKDIDSLREAVKKAQLLDSCEVAVFTDEGVLYWSSCEPTCFNSTAVGHGKKIYRKLEAFKLEWIAFVQVKSESKAKKIIHQISDVIEREVEEIKCEQYWKDRSLYRTSFSLKLNGITLADAILETLELCRGIAAHWTINTPSQDENGHCEFCGSAAERNSISSIEGIDFSLRNFVIDGSRHAESIRY